MSEQLVLWLGIAVLSVSLGGLISLIWLAFEPLD
jgi:hypothetical protein